MRTRAQLLEDLLVERFTHLPQNRPPALDGPSAELMRRQRHDELEAAQVVAAFPDGRSATARPAPDQSSATEREVS